MKKFALYTFLSLSSVLIAGDGLKYEIEPIIGYNSFDSSSEMESTFMYGIRGTIHSNNYYGYRVSYQRSDDVHYDGLKQKIPIKKTTDVQRISGQVLMNGEEEYKVVPYILLGLGFESLSDETNHDVSQGYIEGGLGFKYSMYDSLYINLEGQVLKKFDTDDVDYGVNFGFGYMLGYSISKPELYQPSALAEIPIADRKSPIIQEKIKKKVFEPVVKDKLDARYTFNEEQKPYIPEISVSSVVPDTAVYIATPVVSNYQPLNENLYYVQMAAWFNSSDEQLLNRLENEGFPYDIENTVRQGKDAQIVRVGPYEQYSDAKLALSELKRIKKDAYITKIK